MARVLRMEAAQSVVLAADLREGAGAMSTATAVRALLAQTTVAGGESELACAGGKWLAARLRQGPALPERARRGGAAGGGAAGAAGAAGAWLLTGGLGGLGLRAASLLAEEYPGAPLLLSSRSGRVPRDGQSLDAMLGKLSATAHVLAADVGDAEAARALCLRGGPRLRGVLHAAGLLRDMMHTRMSADDVSSVFGPKACGAAHLHAATLHAPLGSMVYYSSAASAFGSAGQANYAAANAYLDSLGGCRSAVGASAVCLQFPIVSGAGMGAATFDKHVPAALRGWVITLDQYARCVHAALGGPEASPR